MAESSWPGADPATVTEHQFEQWAEYAWLSGLVGSPLDPPPVYGDSTGMHVKIPAGLLARVLGRAWTSGPTVLVVPIAGNTTNSPRVDLVVLRLDRSTWKIGVHVVEGAPGGGVPAVAADLDDSGEWDLIIGRVDIPAGEETTITAQMVTPNGVYLGAQLLLANSQLPAVGGPRPPFGLWYQPDSDRLMLSRPAGTVDVRRDTGWVALNEVGAVTSGWEVTRATHVRLLNGWVQLNVGNWLRVGGSIARGTDTRLLTALPTEYRYRGPQSVDQTLIIGNDRAVRAVCYRHGSSSGRGGQLWITNHGGVDKGDTVYGASMVWSV